MSWTIEDLDRIGAADELDVAPEGSRRRVPIWVVRVGEGLYVRSWRGDRGGWYRAAKARGRGHISAGGVERDIEFVTADDTDPDAIDAAYRDKYARYPTYVEPMVSTQARETTLKLVPRETGAPAA